MGITTIRRQLFSATRELGADQGTIEQRLRKGLSGEPATNVEAVKFRIVCDAITRN